MKLDSQAITKVIGYAMFLPLIVGLPIALFSSVIDVGIFSAVAVLWLLVSIFLIIGPESISEISFWQASIKRDAKAATEAKNEAEAIRDELKTISKLNLENVYLLTSLTAGVYKQYGTESLPAAFQHIINNLEELTPFISSDTDFVDKWQQEMKDIMRAG
ncbi:hypothetical protein ALP72_03595 [Pseudomonas coronafaciens pv. coronafaciens]|uniref:hypothetical protein n=1 Tax=Pseudomonas coronafaciens TaxID=53409 RepID=UPI000F009EC1|nr:hypothetical protein [Pseudomonas coronafaciens]RMS09284.1 hypothetical protein ALP72_03595 [Pseudomonas coronafaciens pv. coronafaciens]